tara:strand:- start:1278 stop:1877 length:600 start_codon:yes stop_codon:yes gene_type:complete
MDFDPLEPTSIYPKQIQEGFRSEAERLNWELDSFRLEVILVPAPEPMHASHMVRTAVNTNPPWYSGLYFAHPNFKRKRFRAAVGRVISGKDGPYRTGNFVRGISLEERFYDKMGRPIPNPGSYTHHNYDSIARELSHSMLTEGYFEEGWERIPNNEIRTFFGLPPIKDLPTPVRDSRFNGTIILPPYENSEETREDFPF